MDDVYLGRIVAVARSRSGALAAIYRVSSRSFPNRQAVIDRERGRVSIVPRAGHEADMLGNPYITYNCARIVGSAAIVTNGSQTDPIAEKVASGMPIRDALVYSLCAMDYEKDSCDTPRIAAIVKKGEEAGWLGIVRRDGLDVRRFELPPGSCVHLSTYEHHLPDERYRSDFEAVTAEAGCAFALAQGVFARFTNPVAAVCLLEQADGFAMACRDSC